MEAKLNIKYFFISVIVFYSLYTTDLYAAWWSDNTMRAFGLLPPKPVPSQPIKPTGPLDTPPKSTLISDQSESKVEKSLEQQQSTHDVLPSSSEMSSGSPLVSSLPSTSSPVVSTVEIGVGTDDLAHQPSVCTMGTQHTKIPQESRSPSTTLTMNLQERTSAHFSIDIFEGTSTTFNPERRNLAFPMFHHSDLLAATPGVQHSRTAPSTCEEGNVLFQEVIMHNLMEFRTKITELEEQIGEMKYNLKELTEQLKTLMIYFEKSE